MSYNKYLQNKGCINGYTLQHPEQSINEMLKISRYGYKLLQAWTSFINEGEGAAEEAFLLCSKRNDLQHISLDIKIIKVK